jgi:altronate hydrolase
MNAGEQSLHLHESDQVAVAMVDLAAGAEVAGGVRLAGPVPRGHKFALRPIAAGEQVRKFGIPIGRATAEIPAGGHVHTHNLAFEPSHTTWDPATAGSGGIRRNAKGLSFEGYMRPDGRVGTRNYLGVLTTVNCSATVAKLIAERFRREVDLTGMPDVDGVVALSHQHGCTFRADGPSLEILRRTLGGYARHPNFAGVLVVGLGCEDNQVDEFLEKAGLSPGDRLERLIIQEEGGTEATVAAGVARLKQMLDAAAAARRETVEARHLKVGLQCGGSDGFSGLTANPALGRAADLLAAEGGTAILSETPEIYGAESLLLARAATPEVGEKLLALLRWWEDHARHDNGSLDNNPSPGNKAGGITTILEKSLGAVAKSGHSPLTAVYRYAEPITAAGAVFMDSPGYDPVSATGQVASGANMICFTTGRGSCFGAKPAPSLKLATNTPMYKRMEGDMDINCGEIADGTATLDEMGERILDLMLRTASGERSRSERLGYGDEEFVPWSFGAMY